MFNAVGSAPGTTPCQLAVAPLGSTRGAVERTVSGEFRETIVVNPSSGNHRVTLSCDSAVVADRTFKYGRDVRMGGELLVNGGAP